MATTTSPGTASPATTPKQHRSFFGRNSASAAAEPDKEQNSHGHEEDGLVGKPSKWSMGVLNDPYTHEVPGNVKHPHNTSTNANHSSHTGSVLLLTGHRNEPLGLRNTPARTSGSSLPSQPGLSSPQPRSTRQSVAAEGKKKTPDGAIILEPQPDDSHNDPLNWPSWKRDAALVVSNCGFMISAALGVVVHQRSERKKPKIQGHC